MTAKKLEAYFALFLLMIFGVTPVLVLGQEPGGVTSQKMEVTWRVEVYLHFTGTIKRRPGLADERFDFEMGQLLSMARDNGDYLFADAAMPVCKGHYYGANGEMIDWSEKSDAVLEPRFYYLSREQGMSRLPLVIRERNWPERLPHLVMPRSAEARFVKDGVSYRRHLIKGDNRIELVEERLFDPGPLVVPIDWQWKRENKNGFESHHLKGELRFVRIENAVPYE